MNDWNISIDGEAWRRRVTLTWSGPTPSKKNGKRIGKLKGRPVIFSSRRHAAWETQALWEVKRQLQELPQVFPIKRAALCHLEIFYGDRHAHDNSNLWESVADLLVRAGVLEDDKWQVTGATLQTASLRPKAPGWNITIIPAEGT